jgi:peptide/nickel transport system substrate-binding protein
MVTRRGVNLGLLASAALLLGAPAALAGDLTYTEAPMLAERVKKGELPPVAERLPQTPLVSDMLDRGRSVGRYGGDMRSFAAKAKDLRYLTANSYTRLVGYDEKLNLKPDVLEKVETDGEKSFTLTLRQGHRWSDGKPFTAEDFRYWWEDVATDKDLSPFGPPEIMMVDGKLPKFEVLNDHQVRYTWDRPNPRFLPALAQPRPVYIYSPSHYLKKFNAKYRDPKELEELAKKAKVKSWAALHNRLDDPYEFSNIAMPTLGPWRLVTEPPANRFVFERNPYFHRVDPKGQQLPYVDRIVIDIASPGLFAAKANAGEADILSRGLSMADVPVLKEGEHSQDYRTLLWPTARGSAYALYPNLTVTDPVWRKLNRDVRFRRALSLAIDRHILNNALLFGLGAEGNNTVMPESPLFTEKNRLAWTQYDPETANGLLDEVGLTERDALGFRKLPDGRTLEIVAEVDGESGDLVDALQLIAEMYRDVGVKLFVKPQDRTILRQRAYSGQTVMVASSGLDNAIPTPLMPPAELAPVRQDNYAWPKWGQYVETRGKTGEAPDDPGAKRLAELFETWSTTSDADVKHKVWEEMLALHAENQWVIGTVTGDIQPIVVSKALKNVPEKAVFSWEPTSLLGIYRIDEFYYDR